MSPRTLFRTFAIAEAVTWALLIGGMLLKYGTRTTEVGVQVAGPIHGFVFLAFVAVTAFVAVNQRWAAGTALLALLSAVIPFASVAFEVAADRRGLLAGPWRTRSTGDPRDARPLDRALRWILAHTRAAAVGAAALVAAVFAALLVAGPPVAG